MKPAIRVLPHHVTAVLLALYSSQKALLEGHKQAARSGRLGRMAEKAAGEIDDACFNHPFEAAIELVAKEAFVESRKIRDLVDRLDRDVSLEARYRTRAGRTSDAESTKRRRTLIRTNLLPALRKVKHLDSTGATSRIIAQLRRDFPEHTVWQEMDESDRSSSSEHRRSGIPATGTSAKEVAKQYLPTWLAILHALGLKNSREERQRVSKLNDSYSGPILFTGQGQQPKSERQALITWWNSLASIWKEQARRREDKSATTAPSYKHGRNAVVLPEIRGHVKKRRIKR